MAGRAKENLPGGSLKYQFLYLKIRVFKCSYRIYIYIYMRVCVLFMCTLCMLKMYRCVLLVFHVYSHVYVHIYMNLHIYKYTYIHVYI